MREPEWIKRVAQALRAMHRGPSLPARFNSFRVVEDYRTTAFSHGAEVPPSYAWARQVARRVERARGAFAERPCHNDLLNANFIDDGRRLRIVDWEYAGMGDVFFDLANFSINHELDRDGREALLEAYFGELRASNERALELMLFMSDFREAMWGVIQGAMSELDFDFGSYAAEHFERMEVTAASPAFVSALESALRRSRQRLCQNTAAAAVASATRLMSAIALSQRGVCRMSRCIGCFAPRLRPVDSSATSPAWRMPPQQRSRQ